MCPGPALCGAVLCPRPEGAAVRAVRAGAVPGQPRPVRADVPGRDQGQGQGTNARFLILGHDCTCRSESTRLRATCPSSEKSLKPVPLRAVIKILPSCQTYSSRSKTRSRVKEFSDIVPFLDHVDIHAVLNTVVLFVFAEEKLTSPWSTLLAMLAGSS